MNRSWLLCALLIACSSPPSPDGGTAGAGTSGGGGGGGTSGGAATSDAGAYSVFSTTEGALFVPGGTDAAITLERIDGGWRFGPEGLSFPQGAPFIGTHRFGAFTDAGLDLPAFSLVSADGGVEPIETTIEVPLVADGEGWVMAKLPHFTDMLALNHVATIGAALYPGIIRPQRSKPLVVNLQPSPQVQLSALTLTAPAPLSVTATSPFFVSCTGTGSAKLQITTTATKTNGPPTTVHLLVPVTCGSDVPPGQPVACTNGDSCPVTTPASRPEDVLSSSPDRVISLYPPVLPAKVGGTISGSGGWGLPCGVSGNGPCSVGAAYLATVSFTNNGPFAAQIYHEQTFLHAHGESSGGMIPAGPPGYLYLDDPPSATTATANLSIAAGETCTSLFQFHCKKQGLYTLSATFKFAVTGEPRRYPVSVQPILVRCGGTGDAVMLSDNTRVSWNGTQWTAMPTGVTANVIAATDAVLAKFGAASAESTGYDAVAAFNSRLGFPKLRLQSSLQTGVFTHNGTRYAQAGLVGSAAFAATDTLTVTGLLADGGAATFPDGGPAVLTLSAPPPLPAPNALFGPRAGLATEVRLPDGTFDVLYVAATAPSPRGGEGGILRTVRAADMTLDAGVRSAPLLSEDDRLSLTAWGLSPSSIYVAAYRQLETEALFTATDGGPATVPVQAGRMIQVTTTDLGP